MYRLSLIIGEIYNKFLPLTQNRRLSLNLDFSDTTQEITDPEAIKTALEAALESAFQRTDKGEINIVVQREEILITDPGTILSKTACALLSHGRVQVSSRVGFGTTVRIALKPNAESADSPKLQSSSPAEPQGASKPAKTPSSAQTTTPAKPTKPARPTKATQGTEPSQPTQSPQTAKSSQPAQLAQTAQSNSSKAPKTSRASQRQLRNAAKKANKKVQKLAKKAQKHPVKAQKPSKTTKPSASGKQEPNVKKTTTKTRKVIHKLHFS